MPARPTGLQNAEQATPLRIEVLVVGDLTEHLGLSEELRDTILASERCTIMIMGGSDTGKTTLVEMLADWLAASRTVAIVDADMGQSHIGPPTAIGWGLVKEKFCGWETIEVEEFYFVGATSPYMNLLPTVVGAKLMCDEARRKARSVIIDTTGLISGTVGCILKWSKLDAIQPNIVLAIQKENELESILAPYSHASTPQIVRLKAAREVLNKSVDQRTAHRERLFALYFENSSVTGFSANRVSLRCADGLSTPYSQNLTNRIVSLRNATGRDIALGILVEIAAGGNSFLLRTPLKDAEPVRTIVIGGIRISADGKKLGAFQ